MFKLIAIPRVVLFLGLALLMASCGKDVTQEPGNSPALAIPTWESIEELLSYEPARLYRFCQHNSLLLSNSLSRRSESEWQLKMLEYCLADGLVRLTKEKLEERGPMAYVAGCAETKDSPGTEAILRNPGQWLYTCVRVEGRVESITRWKNDNNQTITVTLTPPDTTLERLVGWSVFGKASCFSTGKRLLRGDHVTMSVMPYNTSQVDGVQTVTQTLADGTIRRSNMPTRIDVVESVCGYKDYTPGEGEGTWRY